MKFVLGVSGDVIWVPPGGGINSHEEAREALEREIYEETGCRDLAVGPLVWRRNHRFVLNGEEVDQFEEYFLCATDEFEVQPTHLEDGDERTGFREMRWWDLAAIERSRDLFVPRSLHRELVALLEGDPSKYPIEVDA